MASSHDVEPRLLRSFVVLAEELNFGRAAERVHMTQPALSAQIRQLEQKLGLRLFVRSTRRVGLTAEGAALLEPARNLLSESDRFGAAVAQTRGRPERRLVFGAALYIMGLPEHEQLLEAFYASHPHLPFAVLPIWQREMARSLIRGDADLALMLGVAVPLAQWEAETGGEVMFPDSLPRLILREQRVGLLVPRESDLADQDVIDPLQLRDERIAMLGGAHGGSILGPLRKVLGAADARLVVPPEASGFGVERYGRQFRIPAVSLGWLKTGGDDDPDMVWRPVQGLDVHTELALVRSPSSVKPSVALLWEEAKARFPQARPGAEA